MGSYDAIKAAIGTNARFVADRFRLSPRTIYNWMEPFEDPSDSGAINPVHRVEEIIETSLTLTTHPQTKEDLEPYAPLEYLAHRFGKAIIDLPQLEDCDDPSELMAKFNEQVKEAGDFLSVTAQAVANGSIERDELPQIEKEGWEAVNAILHVMEVAKVNQRANRLKRRRT